MIGGVRTYIGVTDWDWYQFLRARRAQEVNFWRPGGGGRFGAVPPGSPFLFKSNYAHGNRIVGGGVVSGWASLPLDEAWDFFREGNGCGDLSELRVSIAKYRGQWDPHARDPEIGCVMLRDVHFLDPDSALPAPPDWKPNLVQGRKYLPEDPSASYVEHLVASVFGLDLSADLEEATAVPGDVFGAPRLAPVRVGQRAFKALVQEAYGRRCAVTGDKIVPVLQAAHIRPVTDEGLNRVDNGLLLRSDVHTLFDRGYLGVDPKRRTLIVSPRLRSDWGNGEEFYRRAEDPTPISAPERRVDRPNREFLEWHADTVFLAS